MKTVHFLSASVGVSWPRYCGGGKLELYSSAEGEQPDAKKTTNVYERVQGRSCAFGEDKRQEYQKGSPETWALETVPCITGANNWQSKESKRFLAVGIRRPKEKRFAASNASWKLCDRNVTS